MLTRNRCEYSPVLLDEQGGRPLRQSAHQQRLLISNVGDVGGGERDGGGRMKGRDVVVVTGASAGVGRATARRFAECGAAVALLARGEKGLAGAAEEVRAAGGTPLVVPVDMAEHKEV